MEFQTIHLQMKCCECQRTSPDVQFLYKCIICKTFDNSKYCEFCLDSHIFECH
jgi:hypothetical protein